jgi:SAM-dependent methyltransferase
VRPRTAFFREAWRILRPGGVLSVADLLVGLMTQEPWMSLWPPVNVVGGPAVYADQLRAAGFAGVDVTDVTARTIVPTVLYRIARVHRLAAAGAISAADHAQRMTRLASIGRIFPGYVLATARKPEAA